MAFKGLRYIESTRVCGVTGSASARRWDQGTFGYLRSILGPNRVI